MKKMNDKMDALEILAQRARLEPMPMFRANAAAVRFRQVPAKLPTLMLCLSSSLTGLAACVMVAIALNQNTAQTTTWESNASSGNQVSTTQAGSQKTSNSTSNNSAASDPSSALFSPLFAELP